MKKALLLLFVMSSYLCYSQDCSFSPFNVALDVDSESDTNIRNNPNGDIILKLNTTDEFVLRVTNYKDNWLKIDLVNSIHYNYDITNIEGWVHQSTVGLWTRKKITLLDTQKNGKDVGSIDGENGPVKIINICAKWVEIEFNGLIGWIELEWLCGNPVTTCP